MAAIQLAAKLTDGLTTDMEKIKVQIEENLKQ